MENNKQTRRLNKQIVNGQNKYVYGKFILWFIIIIATHFIRSFMLNAHMFECRHRHSSIANRLPCHFSPKTNIKSYAVGYLSW